MRPLKFAWAILLIIALITSACGEAPASHLTPAPIAPTSNVLDLGKREMVEGVTVYPEPIRVQTPPPADHDWEVAVLSVDEDFIKYIGSLTDEQRSTKGPGMLSLTAQQGCPPEIMDLAVRLLRHLQSVSDKNRMERLSRHFWPAMLSISLALSTAEVELRGYAIAEDGLQASLWFAWFDSFRGKTRELMLLLTTRPHYPSLTPLGEVLGYGNVIEGAVRLFLNVVYFDRDSGAIHGRLFLSDLAIEMLKDARIKLPFQRLTVAAVARIKPAMQQFGLCLMEAINADPAYQAWKNESDQRAAGGENTAEFRLGFASQEEAVDSAKNLAPVLIGISFTLVIVKIAVAGGLQQWWVLLVPTP